MCYIGELVRLTCPIGILRQVLVFCTAENRRSHVTKLMDIVIAT